MRSEVGTRQARRRDHRALRARSSIPAGATRRAGPRPGRTRTRACPAATIRSGRRTPPPSTEANLFEGLAHCHDRVCIRPERALCRGRRRAASVATIRRPSWIEPCIGCWSSLHRGRRPADRRRIRHAFCLPSRTSARAILVRGSTFPSLRVIDRPHGVFARYRCPVRSTLATGAGAGVLAHRRPETGLGEPRLGGADRLPGGGGRRPGLPGPRAEPRRRPAEPRRQLLPAGRGRRRPGRRGQDAGRPRQRRAALASRRILAIPRRERRVARHLRPGPRPRRPAVSPRRGVATAPVRTPGGAAPAPRPLRARRPDRPRAGAPATPRPGRRGLGVDRHGPGRRRAGDG